VAQVVKTIWSFFVVAAFALLGGSMRRAARGRTPPTTTQIGAMARWLSQNGRILTGVIDDAKAAAHSVATALNNRDVEVARSACEDFTQTLTIRLPPTLPTPDPDETNGLQSVVDLGDDVAAKCAALT
jgi:hypothetical protein